MSDSNRIQVAYKKETTYGQNAGNSSDAEYASLRITGESLHQETSTITSAEIRSDRQISDVVRSNLNAAGDTNFELSYNFTDLLESALMSDSTWAGDEASGSLDILADGTNQRFTASTGTPFSAMDVGAWVKVAGFSGANNNGYFKVKAIVSSGLSIDVEGDAVTDEDTSTGRSINQGSQILNGVLQSSYTIQRNYLDNTGTGYNATYGGMMIDNMTISATTEAVVTGSFSWLGKKEESSSANTLTHDETATTIADPNTEDVMNTVDDVAGVLEGRLGTSGAYDAQTITAFSMSLSNNLRPRLEIGTLGAVSIGTGTCNVSGTFQRYYSDASMVDKYLNFNDSSLAIAFNDADGNAFVLDFPKIIYTSAQRVAGGQNQDIICDMAWEAVADDTEDITIRITKWTDGV